MTTQFATPTQLISSLSLLPKSEPNSRKLNVAAKRAAIREWLATPEGAAYLAKLLAIDPTRSFEPTDDYNNMVKEEAGLRDPKQDANGLGKLVKSKAGSWARECGNKACALTAGECAALGLTPGPANY